MAMQKAVQPQFVPGTGLFGAGVAYAPAPGEVVAGARPGSQRPPRAAVSICQLLCQTPQSAAVMPEQFVPTHAKITETLITSAGVLCNHRCAGKDGAGWETIRIQKKVKTDQ